jgi:hypothetical protein
MYTDLLELKSTVQHFQEIKTKVSKMVNKNRGKHSAKNIRQTFLLLILLSTNFKHNENLFTVSIGDNRGAGIAQWYSTGLQAG